MVFFFAASAFHGQGRDPPLFAQGIQGTVQGSGSQPYPSSGQAVVTGAGGSKVRVTANSATSVTVSLDANGDGTYETSVNKPWSELR